jgi:SAM-dependent methyltransferase
MPRLAAGIPLATGSLWASQRFFSPGSESGVMSETKGQDYEYRGLMARLWDAFRGDTTQWPDQILWRKMAWEQERSDAGAGALLDVGCGTGRLLLDLLSHGVDAEGVDNSPEMLALCREKAAARGLSPVLYEQPMERLDLPRRYRTILVPSSSFQLLTDPSDAAEAMRRFGAHLEPGGMLALPFMDFWRDGEPLSTDWQGPREVSLPDGTLARRWTRSEFDPETRCESTEDRWEVVRGEVTIAAEHHRRSPATRWYSQVETIGLLQSAGFTEIRLLHEFEETPASPDDRMFTALAVRP